MPSKNKKQFNLFKNVKAFVDGGENLLLKTWRETNPGRKITDEDFIKIKKIADSIKYADLEDLTSGIIGDETLGNVLEVKVGYWMKFKSKYKVGNLEKENVFIAKIAKVRPDEKIASFNYQDIYNKNAIKINPLKRINASSTEQIWLDYVHFNQIQETAKSKEELIMKNEIRKLVRNILEESFSKDNDGLKIKKSNSNEMVSVKTGMHVEKKSDKSKGIVKNVGINFKKIPNVNNLNVQWFSGDLSGTKQTVDLDDVEAI